MQTTTLSFTNIHQHGELFANLFRARRESFILRNNWDLPQTDGMEFDQYDTPQARWIAVHEYGQVLAGARLAPTTARCGVYSYMIRDAQRGILGGDIPQDLLWDEAPVDPNVWELTRGFIRAGVPQSIRREVQIALTHSFTVAAREAGASRMLGMVASSWPRWTRIQKMEAEAIGPKMCFADGEFQCISINLIPKLH